MAEQPELEGVAKCIDDFTQAVAWKREELFKEPPPLPDSDEE